jgi:hypothetical protein
MSYRPYILPFAVLLGFRFVDIFVFHKNIVTPVLVNLIPIYIGERVYKQTRSYKAALSFGFLAGIGWSMFSFILTFVGITPTSSDLSVRLSRLNRETTFIVYIATIGLTGILFCLGSLFGAFLAKVSRRKGSIS